MIKSIKSGFTLAEVLTTLMVIGVVAAMTIPTLLNSTQEQTAKTATKKAMSVLSQGAQLIAASDTDCSFTNNAPTSAELASCMKQVMAGEIEAGSDGNNRIKTNDGMEYEFIVPTGASGSDLGMVCGSTFGQYNGANNCLVIVDVMAGKGASIPSTANKFSYNREAGLNESPETATDLVAFGLSLQGARPYGVAGSTRSNAFKYLYGNKAVPELHFCCLKGRDSSDKYTVAVPTCTTGKDSGKKNCTPTASTEACGADYEEVQNNWVATCAGE